MRSFRLWLLATSSALLITGCDANFDSEQQNNNNEISSTRNEVNSRLAAASEASGDLGGAEKLYLKLAKSNTPQATIDLASFYTRHNEPQRAVEILETAYAKSPRDINLMRALANSLISAGNPEKALSMLDAAIAKKEQNAYIYNSRGVALDRLGRYDEAQESYRKAINLEPEDEVDFKTNLSMSYILSGQYNEAITLLTPVVNSKQSTPPVRQNLALAYGLKGDMDKAMKIGSKDLSIKEMNENIRFYSLMTKGKPGAVPNAGSADSANAFPTLDAPPPPISEDAPPVTPDIVAPPSADEVNEAVAAPTVSVAVTPTAQPVTAAVTPAQAVTAAPVPIPPLPEVKPAKPSEPVRDLTPRKNTPASAVPDSGVTMKVVKPVVKPKSKPELLTADEDDAPDTTVTKPATPAIATLKATDDSIPMPVLKPDKW